MPVGSDQGASTFYTGKVEEAHRTPRGVTHLEWKSVDIVFLYFKLRVLFLQGESSSFLFAVPRFYLS
ncbi:hypothetical protein FZC79_01195 [Rossellomorea vietnamensis]|uniref:Uncharacterized protein n=1 Tax=Rossellomorea vietnamensis TaxID=218284 RepID=A0A5D4KMA1_9BACI|nr:hypothetical protein FZC79_01195 [Rossellomorea vietnamensis]